MKLKLILTGLLGIAMLHGQTAVYPGAVVTPNQLKVGVNGVATLLTADINATQTTFSISACARIIPNVLITIDSEIMPVTGCAGTVMVVGSRGFDATPPATHSAGTVINAYVDAWHHNAISAEVQAIESTLGSNMANVVPNAPYRLNANGSVPSTVNSELQQKFELKADFGAAGNGASNDTLPVKAALLAAGGSNAALHASFGVYNICSITPWGSGTSNTSNITLYGDGAKVSMFQSHPSCQTPTNAASLTFFTAGDVNLHDFGYDSLVTNNTVFSGLTGIGIHGPTTGVNTPANSVSIDNLYVAHGPLVGLGCQPCQNLKMSNTTFFQNYWYGFSAASGGSTDSPPLSLRNFTLNNNIYIQSQLNGFSFWLNNITETNEVFDRSTLFYSTVPNAGATISNLTFDGAPDYGCTAATCGTGSITCPICIEGSQNINVGNIFIKNFNASPPVATGIFGGIVCFGSNLGNGGPDIEMPCSNIHVHDVVVSGLTSNISGSVYITGRSNGPSPVFGTNNSISNTQTYGSFTCDSIATTINFEYNGNLCDGATTAGSAFGGDVGGSVRNNRWHNIGTSAPGTFVAVQFYGASNLATRDLDVHDNEIDNDNGNQVGIGFQDNTLGDGYASQIRHYRNICRGCSLPWSPVPAIPGPVVGNGVFVGSGINDCTFGGTYSGVNDDILLVWTSAAIPGVFKWQTNGGSFTAGVTATGSAQNLVNGVTVTCGAATSHTVNDEYIVGATAGGLWNYNDIIENFPALGNFGTSVSPSTPTSWTNVSGGASSIVTVAIASGGTGYAVGDQVVVTQSLASFGQLHVTSVSGGVVTGLAIIPSAAGQGYSTANGLATAAYMPSTGTGLTVNIVVGSPGSWAATSFLNVPACIPGVTAGLTITSTVACAGPARSGIAIIEAGRISTTIANNNVLPTSAFALTQITATSLGSLLGITCNTTLQKLSVGPVAPNSEFEVHADATVSTDPLCFSWSIGPQ